MDGDMEYDMEDDDEYGDQMDDMVGGHAGATGMGGAGNLPKKKKKKKKKKKPQEYEDPSLREHLLAGAYGGVAKPKPKRTGVKYTTDLNAGLRDIATPGSAFHRDSSKKNMMSMQGMAGRADSSHGRDKYPQRNRSSYGRSEVGSARGSKVGSRIGGAGQS